MCTRSQALFKCCRCTRLFNSHANPPRNDGSLHFSDVEAEASKFKQLESWKSPVPCCPGSIKCNPWNCSNISIIWNFLEMQILRHHPRFTEWETWGGAGLASPQFNKSEENHSFQSSLNSVKLVVLYCWPFPLL